jgi:endonuclease/exonuclease/phosphatase family metal-dependent hydrolase
MARKADQQQLVDALVQWFQGLTWRVKVFVVVVVCIALLTWYLLFVVFAKPNPNQTPGPGPGPGPGPNPQTVPAGDPGTREEFLFCWWNLENFFDNKVDGWGHEPDKEYDEWFGTHPDMVELKVKNLTSALLKLNNGIGPDILAVAEVEDSRSTEMPGALVLLRDGLNAGIKDPELHYRNVLWKHMPGGRSIITAILTRLPVDASQTRVLHRSDRTLEGVIRVRDKDLRVIASHWTSRLTDKTGDKRAGYAERIYKHFLSLAKEDANVPLIIAGDFNDGPEEPSVTKHLHAIDDKEKVRAGGDEPYLLELMRNPKFGNQGTIASGARMDIFDHIIATPGLLKPDAKGWSLDPDSISIVTDGTSYKKRGSNSTLLFPLRFNSPSYQGERGCSDHLPVTVTLRLPK